ncbi:MAG: sigma-54 dependent transcriptional regulator, partial [Bacteroidota bacterium]
MKEKILIVDDDPSFNRMLSTLLARHAYDVTSVHSAKSALEALEMSQPDLVLTDFKLPDLNGLELMKLIKQKSGAAPVMILITNYSDVRTAVNSIKVGAFEFVTKPVIPDELLLTIQSGLRNRSVKSKPVPSPILASSHSPNYIVGSSKQNQQVWDHISLVASTKMSVMIIGESGTGKEYAARMIHEQSKRSHQPFATVDCGSLSRELAGSELFGHHKGAFTGATTDKPGLFESANHGTLFLDEVGNLPYDVQLLLLRALQEQKVRRIGGQKDISVDVRLIAATNENMLQAVSRQAFRLDLFHRLNEFEIKLPPLRERLEDLDEYSQLFLSQANQELEKDIEGFDHRVQEVFNGYHWPGNLRELRNIVRRATLICQSRHITTEHIPDVLKLESSSTTRDVLAAEAEPYDLKELHEQQEKETIVRVLEEVRYNKTTAAKRLNIDRSTL